MVSPGVPFLLLSAPMAFRLSARLSNLVVFASSVMLLPQVLLMLWNVVKGGVVAALIFLVPFLLLRQFDKAFPFFSPRRQEARARS